MPKGKPYSSAEEQGALDGLERWKTRHPEAVPYLEPADVLVDDMRGRSSTWTRIRVNLQHVPEELRPEQEPPDPDYDPWAGFRRSDRDPSEHDTEQREEAEEQ